MENKIILTMLIVNNGYAEKAMDIARNLGARGGTIFNAVGSAGIEAEKLYGIQVNPEKEIVMILVANPIAPRLLKAFYENLGADSLAQGIAFTLPVTEATSNLSSQFTDKKGAKKAPTPEK